MSDNVELNAQSGGAVVAADEVTDATLGTVKVQYVKLMDGALDGTVKGAIDANGLDVDVTRVGGTVTIGPVSGTVTSVPSGTQTISGAVSATQSGTWDIGAITTLPAISGTVTTSVGATIGGSAVSVGTAATLLAAASATRRSLGIYNNGAVGIFVGPSGVGTASGFPVAAGGGLFLDKAAADAVYAIGGTTSINVRVITESD